MHQTYARLIEAANTAATGRNSTPEPTPAQAIAGNYRMGRFRLHGLDLRIENPEGTFRSGTDADGQPWRTRLAAHYGYFAGTRGADGDPVDVFIGSMPESPHVWVINQVRTDGQFDEHKVMLGFGTEALARAGYLGSYTPGWAGLGSMVRITLAQLRWWLKSGDRTAPIRSAADLLSAPEKKETTMTPIRWNEHAEPIGVSVGKVLYDIRLDDAGEDLLTDPMTMDDLLSDPEIEALLVLDALVVEAGMLKPKTDQILTVLKAAGKSVQPQQVEIGEPVRLKGTMQIPVIYGMSDGQTLTIWFHNPDTTPAKLAPMDVLVSARWVINKKDVTIVVAPEKGKDLSPRDVARRIMALIEKNSAAFQRVNAKASERAAAIEGLQSEIAGLEQQLDGLNTQIDRAREVRTSRAAQAVRAPAPEVAPAAEPVEAWRTMKVPDMMTAEQYAAVSGIKAAEEHWQDVLDHQFGARLTSTRNAARALGWDAERNQWPMTKAGATLTAEFSHVGTGANIVGITYKVRSAAGAGAAVRDDLTKSPEDLAAEVDALVVAQSAEEPVVPAAADPAAALTAMLTLGWERRPDSDHVVRSWPALGPIGAMVVPDGKRNIYSRVEGGDIAARLGDEELARVTVGADAAAAAADLNAKVEAWVVVEQAKWRADAETRLKPKIPPGVVATAKRWVDRLNNAKFSLDGMERARGRGYGLSSEWDMQQPIVAEAMGKIASLRKTAAEKGLSSEMEGVITQAGGIPDFSTYRTTKEVREAEDAAHAASKAAGQTAPVPMADPTPNAFTPSAGWKRMSASEYRISDPLGGGEFQIEKKGQRWVDRDSGRSWSILIQAQEGVEGEIAAQLRTRAEEEQSRASASAQPPVSAGKKGFTFKVKPVASGGFIIESVDGGGVVLARKPQGPAVLDPVPAKVFKTEEEAAAYMASKGMAAAPAPMASGADDFTAPEGASSAVKAQYARTAQRIADMRAAGLEFMSGSDFMAAINAGERVGHSVTELADKRKHMEDTAAGIKAGTIRPSTLIGAGATKASALAWLQEHIDSINVAMQRDGLAIHANISNYEYYLGTLQGEAKRADLAKVEAEAKVQTAPAPAAPAAQPEPAAGEDMFGGDQNAPRIGFSDLLKSGRLQDAIGMLAGMQYQDALKVLLDAGFSAYSKIKTASALIESTQAQLVKAVQARTDGWGLREAKEMEALKDAGDSVVVNGYLVKPAIGISGDVEWDIEGFGRGFSTKEYAEARARTLPAGGLAPANGSGLPTAAPAAQPAPAAGEDMFGAPPELVPDGAESKVKTAKGTQVVTGFAVVEADSLITSHDPSTGEPNPAFPPELQPRDRGRDASIAWVRKTANDLDPDLLGKTRRADSGAPIIGPDRVVESGNGRTMAVMLAYQTGKAGDYRDWLEEEAESFGLSPEKVRGMKWPVLVRIRTSKVDRAAFAVEANQDDKLAMTATEVAKADAARLTDDVVAMMTEDGDLSAAGNTRFLSAFLRSLGDAEAARYSTSDGKPTASLIARVQAAIFAKAYQDDRLLELTADVAKPEIANIVKALNHAAPEFIQAAALDPDATRDATGKLTDAVEKSLNQKAVDALIGASNVIRQAKDAGQTVAEFVKQQGLFGDLDPDVAAMAVFIADNSRSAKRMGEAFKAMATFIKGELQRRQTADMFGDGEPVDFKDIVAAANRELERMYGAGVETIGLFDRPAAEAPASDPAPDVSQEIEKSLGKSESSIVAKQGKPASNEYKKKVIELMYGGSGVSIVENGGFLSAIHKKTGRGIFIVDGTMNRSVFIEISKESEAAGIDAADKKYIIADYATYTGDGIDITLTRDIPGINSEKNPPPAAAPAAEAPAPDAPPAEPEVDPVAAVNAAYTFDKATDDFKAILAESLDQADYSEFATAKGLDQAVKAAGGTVSWSLVVGAILDSVAEISDGWDLDDPSEYEGVFDSVGEGEPQGVIRKGAKILGRAVFGGDGKAMIYVGKAGADRVTINGQRAMWGEEPGTLVSALFTMATTPTEPKGKKVTKKDAAKAADQLEWLAVRLNGKSQRELLNEAAILRRRIRDAVDAIGALKSGWPEGMSYPQSTVQLMSRFLEKIAEAEAAGDDLTLGAGDVKTMAMHAGVPESKFPDILANPKSTRVSGGITIPSFRMGDVKAAISRAMAPAVPAPAAQDPDVEFLRSVIDKTAPDMLDPDLADKIEAVVTRRAGDAQIDDLAGKAIDAFMNSALEATAGIA